MKTRKFIFRKLISGKVKLTPEVLRGLKELGAGEGAGVEKPKPGEFVKPKRPPVESPTSNSAQRSHSQSSAGWEPAVSPTGSRPAVIYTRRVAPVATPAGYQPATQQTASLRYEEAAKFVQADKTLTHSSPKSQCDSWRQVFVSLLPGHWVRCPGAAVACACVFLAGTVFAAGQPNAFDAANAAFAQGKFGEAARGFESVLARDGYSAPVLYNLANAQVREGKLGPAILSYERALALAPNDPDIAANLKLAQTKAGLWTGEPTRLSRFTHSLSLNTWASVAAGALLVLGAAIPLRRTLRRGQAALALSGAFAAVALMLALFALALRWPDLDRAVVTTKNCPARISPATLGETVFSVPEGDAVTIRQTRGDFALIQSRAGRTGWVKRDEIRPVLASAGR